VREQVWSGKDWVVVWLLLLRRVVTSKPPPCSHRHCHKQTGRRFVCCEWHVQMSRASKQVKYGILTMSLRLILQARTCVVFTVSSRLPNAQSHVANHRRKPHQSLSLMLPPTLACPELLTCFSFSLTKSRDDNVARDYQNQSNTTAYTPTRCSIFISRH
jgi:hypothetical protein